ncbi:neuronal PAS domain-containing protein 4 [Chrysoperla carnea]|uniref:neuronal PAS domain-containing protein 4 n=1 Tax=Chrysoperla carnea TaxID=189513 RepID=UPI001D096A31|nr:neuronal PAS domain-containing protein 4 [Chrysoperla carnea]
MFSPFDANKSTKGASKLRRDLINAEIANLRDLLPLPPSTRQRLSQLQLMALVCVYVRKTNYFQQAFKCQNVNLQSATPSIGFSKALNGFLMMMTQNGKLLYISDNAAEYLGHSMEDLLIHGDSVYDIIDKQDHSVIQAEMARSASSEDEARMFMCRINVTRNARRQMRFGDQKVVLVQGHYLSFLPLCSRNEPVFIATCTPIAMPETRECVVQGATNVFTSIHSMDMKFMYLDRIGEYHLGFLWVELQGVSWYKLLHWECMQEAQAKHRLITQSDQDRACILLVRLQRRMGDWIWVHCVLQVKDSIENNQHPVIVCTNQILSDREAGVMKANSWLYEYYMVQSKLQYGLTYSGPQQPTTAIPRITPYYHHQHSPQSSGTPVTHVPQQIPQPPPSQIVQVQVQHPPDPSLGTPPNNNEISPQPTSRTVEKLEPVDYSLHQQSTSQYPAHVCSQIGRCFSSSSTGDDSLDTFARHVQMDESGGYQYRSIVTVAPHSYAAAESPDLYSYQIIGNEPPHHLHHESIPTYSGYTQKYLDEGERRHSIDDTLRYTKAAKCKKLSTGSVPSTVIPSQDRDNYSTDNDDVFMTTGQWKSIHGHTPREQNDPENKNNYPEESEMIDINQLGFQNKRKILMPMSKSDDQRATTNSPHWTPNNMGLLSEWSDSAMIYHTNNVYTYDTVRASLVCANKETFCYWKHLENYAKTHLDLISDKYTVCNMDKSKASEYEDFSNYGSNCDVTRIYHHNLSCQKRYGSDKWINPLHPPLPAIITKSTSETAIQLGEELTV